MRLPLVSVVLAASLGLVQALDPWTTPLKSATCSAPNHATGVTKRIQIKYAEFNPKGKRTLLMVHGWPGLWHVWANQIEAFKKDYHIIAINNRGYGGSGHPGDLENTSNLSDYVSDLACVLQDAKVSHSVCIAHDWGSQICYEANRQRPDIFDGVIATAIPYLPYAGPLTPIEAFLPAFPRLGYQVYFQNHTANATRELNRDVRRTLRAILRTADSAPPPTFLTQTDSFLTAWNTTPTIPPIPFLSKTEEDYWVTQYAVNGWGNTLGLYTHGSRLGSWSFAQSQGNQTIPQPALSILPTQDPVADWVEAAVMLGSASHIPKLVQKTVNTAHWVPNENPAETNAIMKEWLDVNYPPN